MTNTRQHDKCDLVIGPVDQQYRLAYEPGTALVLFLHNNAMKWNPVPA
ncbi:hypothetical protein FFLO_05816 [Filobasidium floriforme]|uniref:Uncharacterized protein n=1 Tax=Filobasidium floriforme TaxID=5210 RepID=A0A8K0JGN5_9TREE|nr:hypothetical protein FFLO_05816 [Filobasidium floriforme]